MARRADDRGAAVPRNRPGGPDECTAYTFGTLLLRVICHYRRHNGENAAIRQALGHVGLPEFVGDIDAEAPYRPE